MIEKDDIQELFSKSLENHTTPVRPEVWTGLQAKMAAAGLTAASGTATVAKGMSLVTKWIIGSAAVITTAVATTVIVMQQDEPAQPAKQELLSGAPDFREKTTAANETAPEKAASKNPGTVQQPQSTETNRGFGYDEASDNGYFGSMRPHSIPALPNETSAENESREAAPSDLPATQPGEENGKPAGAGMTPETPEKEVRQPEAPERPVVKEAIVLPNVFSPGGNDYINNSYQIIENANLVSETGFSVVIMDATTSKTVFKDADPHFQWDGTFQGNQLPAGKYICIVIGAYKDGRPLKMVQSIDIERK